MEDISRPALRRAELPRLLRRGDVEEFVLARCQIAQNSRADGHWREARADTFQIDLNRLDGFRFLFVFLFFLLFVRLFIGGLDVGALLVVFLLVLLFVGRFFFVALRFEWRSFIGLQRDGKNAVSRIIVEPLIELSHAWIEVARRNEIKKFPVVVEDRIVVVIEAGGNHGDFLRSQRIKEYVVGAAPMWLGVGDPQAGRRPTAVRGRAVVGLVHEHRLLGFKADVPKPEHFVPVEKLLVVR